MPTYHPLPSHEVDISKQTLPWTLEMDTYARLDNRDEITYWINTWGTANKTRLLRFRQYLPETNEVVVDAEEMQVDEEGRIAAVGGDIVVKTLTYTVGAPPIMRFF